MSKKELMKKSTYNFSDLVEIVDLLRAPDGCPWDREQTHQSIRKGLIEETYEVVEGIDRDDSEIMCEELGDLLLQVVFHASIAKDDNRFDLDKICDGICKKLIYRHPHVFSTVEVADSDEVLRNWDELKQKEKKQQNVADVLDGVSRALPSLMRAQKLIKKADDETDRNTALENILNTANNMKNEQDLNESIGKLLFECARLANTQKIDLEQALYNENEGFCAKMRKKY